MYQMIHGIVALISSGIASSFARHNARSRLLKIELLGNIPGECGKSARAQAWTDGGYSKSRWFRVSSSAPHFGQDRSVPQWRSESELQTGRQLEIACQMKCCIFLEVLSFQTLAWRVVILGSRTCSFSGCSSVSMAKVYPDLTEYTPDLVRFQQ